MTFNEQWFHNLTTEEKAFVIKTQVDRELLAPWVLEEYLANDQSGVPEHQQITREQIETYVDIQLQRHAQRNGRCLMPPYITEEEWSYHREHGAFPGTVWKVKQWFNQRFPKKVTGDVT